MGTSLKMMGKGVAMTLIQTTIFRAELCTVLDKK
jgi:hypothetical protein